MLTRVVGATSARRGLHNGVCTGRGVHVAIRTHRLSSSALGGSSGTVRVGGCPLPVNAISLRFVQFEQSSETVGGFNNRKKRAQTAKWITKSTKDYMSEIDRSGSIAADSLVSSRREQLRGRLVEEKDRGSMVKEEARQYYELEMARIQYDNARRARKGWNFFKRQGKGFLLLYVGAYCTMLALLYLGFASGVVKKEIAFEFLLMFLNRYINRELFYQRVEAWDTYINFGFAFVINEMLEVIRLPFVMVTFFFLRRQLTGVNRLVKGSLFRTHAPES